MRRRGFRLAYLYLIGLAVRAGALPAPPPVYVPFGNLTTAGTGGFAVAGTAIISGNASGHWPISGGLLTPSVAGDTANLNAGPYTLTLNNGDVLNVDIIANRWSVRTSAEWTTIATQAAANLLGRGVQLRAGEYALGINPDTTGTPLRRMNLIAGRFVIEAADPLNFPVLTDRVRLSARGVTFKELDMRGAPAANAPASTTVFSALGTVTFPTSHTKLLYCVLRNPDRPFEDTPANTTIYQVNGPNSIGWTTACTSIATNGSGYDEFEEIIGCSVYGARRGIQVPVGTSHTCRIENNYVSGCYDIGIKPFYQNGALKCTVNFNTVEKLIAKNTDVGNPHPDYILFTGSAFAISDWEVECCGNRMVSNGRSNGAGIAFRDFWTPTDGDSTRSFIATVVGNAFDGTTPEGLIIEQGKNVVVRNNTFTNSPFQIGSGSPQARISGQATVVRNYASAFTIVQDGGAPPNITGDNISTALNDTFDRTVADPTTLAEFMSSWSRKAGGPADIAGPIDIGAIGSGAVTWPTTPTSPDGVYV